MQSFKCKRHRVGDLVTLSWSYELSWFGRWDDISSEFVFCGEKDTWGDEKLRWRIKQKHFDTCCGW